MFSGTSARGRIGILKCLEKCFHIWIYGAGVGWGRQGSDCSDSLGVFSWCQRKWPHYHHAHIRLSQDPCVEIIVNLVTDNHKRFMICGGFICKENWWIKNIKQLSWHPHGWITEIYFFPLYTINIWHEFSALITDAERRQRQIFILHSCFTVKTLFGLFIQFHCYSFYGR